ncbi:MAG: MFS transporter [Chloroflexota bacterium]
MIGALFVEHARPDAIREHRFASWLAVGTVCMGAFMGQLDASIVTLTFPAMQAQFHAPLAAVEWVSLSYLVTLVGLVAGAGRVSDAYGRKLMYLYGFVVFTAASAACALAPSLSWLIAFRVVQAVGAALLQANSVALVVTSVARGRMREALSVQAAAQALGLALGPTVGGALVLAAGWQWVFWVNVPVGIVALIAGHFLLPRTRDRAPLGAFDWPGLVLLASASTTFLLAISAVSGLGLSPVITVSLFVSSLVLTGMFVARELLAASPLLDLHVLRPAGVSVGLLGALAAYLVLFGPLALFPQVIGAHEGGAALGLAISALPAGFAISAVGGNRWLRSADTRARALGGAAVSAAALAMLLFVGHGLVAIAVLLGVLGLGLGVFIPANNAAIMGAIPSRSAAVGGGLLNMGRGLGTALGVALVTLCLHLSSSMSLGLSGGTLALLCLLGVAVLAGVAGAVPGAARAEAPAANAEL